MQYLLTLTLGLASLYAAPAAAKHAECYWTGPGNGTPEQQGFSLFGTGKKVSNVVIIPHQPPITQYICDQYSDLPVVADWNNLKTRTLEIATACGKGGYSGDCSYGLFGFELVGYKDPRTGEQDPVRYLRKTDDCEWPVAIDEDDLPDKIVIYHK